MIKNTMRKIKWLSYYLTMKICQIFPVKPNKVIFSSYRGRQYSDNPMYISRLLEQMGNIEVVWIYNNSDTSRLNSKIKTVKNNSLRCIYELATSKVWVDNCRKLSWIRKKKNQYYIQTWHGNIALKKIEADAEQKLSHDYVKNAKNDSKMADLFVSGSAWETQNYREAFWYTGEILECGCPRSDVFYGNKDNVKKKVREFYNLQVDDNIIIYAPTFRNSQELSCYNIDFFRLIECAEQTWGGNWKVIIRLHPNMTAVQHEIKYSEKVLNGLLYDNLNDLIITSEVLITDYSSCMFDAMEIGKKVLIYAADVEEYYQERGVYFSFEQLPFVFSGDNDTLIENVVNFNQDDYEKRVAEFMHLVKICNNGDASEIVANRIKDVINTK